MIDRIKRIDKDIHFFDGVYHLNRGVEYLGYIIPAGWVWNGTTGVPTDSKLIKPSMLHDWLLYKGEGRKYCDDIFLKAMKHEGVSKIRRTIYYRVVRLFAKIYK